MKRFKRKQKKLKEKQTARLIAESPLTCALDIWQARKEARAKAEYALISRRLPHGRGGPGAPFE